MPGFNGSGTFVRTYNWATDKTNLVPVTASRQDTEDDGFATGLSAVICRDGQSTTTARIPFAAGTAAFAGATSGVSYAQTNDANTGLYFPAADQWGLVAGGTATLTSTASALTATGTMTVTGTAGATALTVTGWGLFGNGGSSGTQSLIQLSGTGIASGQINTDSSTQMTVKNVSNGALLLGTNNTTRVTIAAGGDVTFAGGVTVTGALAASSTLAVTGNVAVNTDKFTVAAASGNTLVAGTLDVTGNVAVATNKFTVAAASGNTVVAGTLAVTGASTLTGALSANNSAGVTGRNTVKAFGKVINATLQAGNFNVASVNDAGATHSVAFASALANTNYAVLLTLDSANANESITLGYEDVATGGFTVNGYIAAVGATDPDSYSFMVLSNE
jgi:hypothetical protein